MTKRIGSCAGRTARPGFIRSPSEAEGETQTARRGTECGPSPRRRGYGPAGGAFLPLGMRVDDPKGAGSRELSIRFARSLGLRCAGELLPGMGNPCKFPCRSRQGAGIMVHLQHLMKSLNIGLIGCGFMGRTHSYAFRNAGNFFELPYRLVLSTVCARANEKAQAFAVRWGYESVETDWRRLVARKDIDILDIACPNDVHKEIAVAAAKTGKMILCEKPLAMNGTEGLQMVRAVEAAGVPNMVSYNYRRVPAVTLAKQLIDEGRLGRVFHYRAKFLQDWTISSDLPQGGEGLWRLDSSVAGSGVTGDLLAHAIDTAMWLNGAIDEVTAATETFIKSRKNNLTGK